MFQRTLRLYQHAYRGLSPSVWLLAGVMLINRCGTMVLPFLTLYLTQKLHYSVADAGVVMAVFGVGAFVGTFLGGRLTDRFGFYYVQLFSLLFGGLALLLLQFVTHFYALCGSVFVFTLLGDTFRPANQTVISHFSDADTRTRAFSLNRLAINLGWSVGGGLGGWLASFDYSLLFWVDGLTCIVAGLVLWWFLPVPATVNTSHATEKQTTNATQYTSKQVGQTPYRDSLFLSFVMCAALYLLTFMQLFTMVPLFLKETLRLSEQAIGLLMALNGLLIVLIEMPLVFGLERRNIPKLRLIQVGVLLTAMAYGVLATITAPVGALGFMLLITLAEMLTIPFIQSFTVGRADPATRGQYLALYGMGAALAQTTAPVLGAQLVGYFSFATHWSVIVVIGLVSGGWAEKRSQTDFLYDLCAVSFGD